MYWFRSARDLDLLKLEISQKDNQIAKLLDELKQAKQEVTPVISDKLVEQLEKKVDQLSK